MSTVIAISAAVIYVLGAALADFKIRDYIQESGQSFANPWYKISALARISWLFSWLAYIYWTRKLADLEKRIEKYGALPSQTGKPVLSEAKKIQS